MTFTEDELSDDANAIFNDIEKKLARRPLGTSYFEGSAEDIKQYEGTWIKNIPQGVIGAW
jgi:hypothetical protein